MGTDPTPDQEVPDQLAPGGGLSSADLLDAARIQELESYERLLEHEGKQEEASLKSHMYMIWLDDYKRLGDEWIAAFRAYRDQLKSASNDRVMAGEALPSTFCSGSGEK